MYVAHERGVPVVTISPLAENWVVRALSRRVFPDMEDFLRAVQSIGSPAALWVDSSHLDPVKPI